MTTAYEIGELNNVFLSSSANTRLCAVYALDETELREFLKNKASYEDFLNEASFLFATNFETLLAVRVKILKNEMAAQKYFARIVWENIRKKATSIEQVVHATKVAVAEIGGLK